VWLRESFRRLADVGKCWQIDSNRESPFLPSWEKGPGIEGAAEVDQTIQRAVVMGAGTMGSGIAQALATAGIEVTVYDVAAQQHERARAGIERSLGRLAQRGALTEEAKGAAMERIRFATDFGAAAGADVLIEAIVEQVEAKQTLLRGASHLVRDDAILASNTSSISITTLAAAASRPERVVGMHFFNPVPVMALVEVVRGQLTADETVRRTVALAERLGKSPVVVNDYPGFVSNRILLPMLNEAFYALMEGVAEKEAIDTVMKLGMNHPMGPLELADFIGLDVCLHIMEVLHRDLGDDKYRPCPLLRRLVAAGRLGRKSGAGVYEYGDGRDR
jgi:3-hydroxybutyryl-CoA dehydrogenase